MKTNLFSLRKLFLDRSVKAFLLFFFLLIGGKTFAQYSGTGTFTKVTAAAGFTDGYYVVAYGTTQAMNNTHNGTFFAPTAISPTSGTTITNPAKSIVWKIETNGTGKSIYNEDGSVYASYTGSTNNVQAVATATTNNQRWSFTYSGGTFDVQNLGVSGRSLQYNTASPRFACYTGSQQDITLYKMASASYTVTFNANTGTGTMAAQTASSATALTANAFAKTGYAFGGWASSTANATAGTVAYANQGSYPFTSSTTLYAIWGFNVVYNSNSGTGTVATQNGYYNATSSTGAITLNNGSTLTRSGYTFGGWKTTAAGTSANYSAGGNYTNSGSASSVTLYAHWIANTYTLTYNGNGNNTGTPPTTQTGASTYTVEGNSDLIRYGGYYWMGWTTNSNGSGTAYGPGSGFTNTISLTSNTTLYARWVYTIVYLGNDNTGGTVPSQQTNYNSLPTTLSGAGTLVRTGYTFGGWKTTAAGTAADYAAGSSFTPDVNTGINQLYAHWIKNEATLTVTPDLLSGFNYIESHGPSASQSFTVSGEHLDGSSVNLLPGDDYEISLDNGTTWLSYADAPVSVSYTGATLSKVVLVRLKAGLLAGTYSSPSNNIIAIEGGGDDVGPVVTLQGTVLPCLPPTSQSSVSSFTTVGINGMTVNLTAGNGVGRIIKINTINTFADPVSSNTLPTANTVYSGSGEQVIYAGTGNSVAVTGLSPSTTYWVRVYEYNICSGNYTYATATPTNNPRSQITACDVPGNPNGEVDLENPYCGSADLVYQIGSTDGANFAKGVTYYWQTSASGTSTANPLVFASGSEVSNPYNVTVSRIYYVRAYNGSCWSASSYATNTVTFISAINVTSQPANQNAVAGSTATFAVTSSNVSAYQWQISTNGGTTWNDVAGATSASYITPATTLAMSGYRYRVRMSNSCGNVTSNVATLSVIAGPCLSENFSGTVTPSGWLATNVSWTEYSGGGSFNASTGTLTTPKLSRPSKVTFDLIRTTNATAKTLLVKISTTGQNTGFNTTIATYTHSNTASGGTTPIDLDLSDYSTEDQVWIRLEKSSSTTSPWRFDDFEVFCARSCTPAPIVAFPTSGPAGTLVTITGSDFTSGSTVKFGTVATPAQFISATQLKVTVPATANGNIIVDTTLECDSETAFTLIKEDITACEPLTGSSPGGTYASDLIIYEVYDENGGSGGNITIYNGTNATVDLSNYDVYRAGDYGGSYTDYATISGNLAPGSVAVIGVSGSKCGYTVTHGSINGGFNDNDGFRLMKGSTVIDDVKAPNYSGYYLKRKNEYLLPKTTFVDNEWTTESLDANQCLPVNEVGQVPGIRTAPIVTAQPNYSLSCDVVNASLTLTATEGLIGGNALTYQWYVLQNTGTWTTITDGGVYSGAATQVLNISDVAGLNNYQYYCQVRENMQTCYTATTATQIKEAGNTWTSNVWSNGMPVLGSRVVIAGTYNTQVNGILNVCDLTINSAGSMRVKPNFPITVKKKIINNNTAADSFVVESDANLIQTENVANEGSVKVERSVTGMNNNAATAIDYVYWSSPVSGQVIKGSAGFSPNTPATGYMQYNESNDKFVVTNDATFLTGKGYAIRAENVLSNGYNKTYSFTGIPNNGDVSSPVLNRSAGADKGYNLVGNPYPSNIDFDQFHALNSTKIYATAFFWTNNSYTAQQMGSGYAGNNYAIYNITGGVPATYDDGNINYGTAPNGKIKVGQGFIVQSKIAGALDFKNSIRVTDNGTFYQKTSEKNRFWLTMKSPNNLVNTILVGYVSGATNNYETDFDGELFAIGSDSFYSILGTKKLAIQGKSENFSTDDVVALGNVFSVNGTYTIKLQTAEGNFDANQTIYLRDKVLDKYIDLSDSGSYTFEATKGTNNTRFEIVYKNGTLATNENKKSEFLVYKDGQDFVIRSSNKLGRIEVYDISGRLMKSFTTNQATARIDVSSFSNGVFIIKAENSGEIRTKKINK